jgi:integral membrane protein
MRMSSEWMTLAQPSVPAGTIEQSHGHLVRYRVMAFTTGVVLIAGTIALILKYSDVKHMEPLTGLLWVAHGWLYLIYVVVTAMLGVRLRWPLPRYALVMLAGTVPTMSFVAEHFVTQAARAAEAQPVPVSD